MIHKVKYLAALTTEDGVVHTIPSAYLSSVDTSTSLSFQSDTEFALGIAPPITATIVLKKNKVVNEMPFFAYLGRNQAYRGCIITTFISFDNGLTYKQTFSGIIKSRKEALSTLTLECSGFLDILNLKKVSTPLFRNSPVATAIPSGDPNNLNGLLTLLNKQNPYNNQVGIINSILWDIGGRHYKYKEVYANNLVAEKPKFFFDCESSIINPEWVWFNYDNLLNDLELLCRASGGFLFQNLRGVVEYKNVYSINTGITTITLTDKDYTSLEFGDSRLEPYSKLMMTFTPRFLSGSQEVFSDNLNEILYTGQTLVKTIEFQKPVAYLLNRTTSGQLGDTLVTTTFQKTTEVVEASSPSLSKVPVYFKVVPYSGWYTPRYTFSGILGEFFVEKNSASLPSQSTEIQILNSGIYADSLVYVNNLRLYGRALESSKTQNYIKILTNSGSYSGFRDLRLNDNPYIQTYQEASRYVGIAGYLIANPREALTVESVAAAKSIDLGDLIQLYSSIMQVSGIYKVVGLKQNNSGAFYTLNVISTDNLISRNDVYIVGSGYSTAEQKYLGF